MQRIIPCKGWRGVSPGLKGDQTCVSLSRLDSDFYAFKVKSEELKISGH